MSYKLVVFLFLYTLLIPFVYAQNFTIQEDQHEINISLYPNITVPSPTIVIQHDDLSKIEELMKKSVENESSWTEGDLVVASSSIIAIFTFGSVLVIRFEGDKKDEQKKAMINLLFAIAMIQILHLMMIMTIIMSDFSPEVYVLILGITIIFVLIILYSIWKIVDLANYESKRDKEEEIHITPLGNQLEEQLEKAIVEKNKLQEKLDATTRELRKQDHESGI